MVYEGHTVGRCKSIYHILCIKCFALTKLFRIFFLFFVGSDSEESLSSGDSDDDEEDEESDDSSNKTPGRSKSFTSRTPSGGSKSGTPKTPSGVKTPSSTKRNRKQQEDAVDMVIMLQVPEGNMEIFSMFLFSYFYVTNYYQN